MSEKERSRTLPCEVCGEPIHGVLYGSAAKHAKCPPSAINVFDAAANVYWDNFGQLDERLKAKVSIHDMRNIFQTLVEPAIAEVRRLDREGRSA